MTKYINGEDEVFYNYVQAASMVGESDTTLRWWVQELDSILNLPTTDKGTKRFKKKDIENLIYIKKLIREDHYTLAQVKEYCGERFSEDDALINMDNQLQVKAFISALANEFDVKINEMKSDIINQQKELIFKLLENQIQLNEETAKIVSKSTELRNEELINNFTKINKDMSEEISNKISEVEENLSKREDNLDLYFSEIKEKMESMEEKQEKIAHTASLSLEQVQKQMYERKSWLEKLVDKIKDRIE